jgi:hypothetical protein
MSARFRLKAASFQVMCQGAQGTNKAELQMEGTISFLLAKMTMEQFVENGSDEVKDAWKVILAKLEPQPKIKRRI